jgi:hypothetical protein
MTSGLSGSIVRVPRLSVRNGPSFSESESVLLLARLPAFFIGTGYGPRLPTTSRRGFAPAATTCWARVKAAENGAACERDDPSP